jgi:nitroimidazol reductase NimA-like FMN-containing flavoprotein (pyridoxamine 5'-phosphate oxidase superfamily)
MSRNERGTGDRALIDSIIRRSQVCRLGLSDEGQPYVVPLCFGYDGKALYFHCATKGRKLDILRKNDRVCFEFDVVEGMLEADDACEWGLRYQSVIGFGRAREIADPAAKDAALSRIMAQYSERAFSFPPEMVKRTAVVMVEIETLTGKQSKPLA